MTRARRLARHLAQVLLGVLLVGTVTVAGLARLVPALGHPVLVIHSPSMEPAIPVGAAVVLDQGFSHVQPGDVVTVHLDSGEVFTHRVTRLASLEGIPYVETKGDANSTVDPALIPLNHVMGRVTLSLPIAGYLVAGLALPAGVATVLLAALTLLAGLWFLDGQGGSSGEPAPVTRPGTAPLASR